MSKELMQNRNRMAAQGVIKALKKRHLNGYYTETKEEALKLALSLIPEGCSVGWGGSETLKEIGLVEALHAGNYETLDWQNCDSFEEATLRQRKSFFADRFLMSTNAITEDGQLVNMDGNGNRVAALAYGPEKVIVVAGMNKLVKDVEEGIKRTRHTAAPAAAIRFPGDTPCHVTGTCANCNASNCICSHLVVTRNCMNPDRIHVILVGEDLGF